MDLTWLAPSIVLLAFVVGISAMARRLGDAAEDARTAQRRFRTVEQALIPVRVQTRQLRASVDRSTRR